MTQTELATELGRGMSTIQRWEQVVPPRGRALADLAKLARSRGEVSLAKLFETALSEEMGADNPDDKIIARACETAIRNRLLVPAAWKKAVKCLSSAIEELIQKKKTGDATVTSTLEELSWALIENPSFSWWRGPFDGRCETDRRHRTGDRGSGPQVQRLSVDERGGGKRNTVRTIDAGTPRAPVEERLQIELNGTIFKLSSGSHNVSIFELGIKRRGASRVAAARAHVGRGVQQQAPERRRRKGDKQLSNQSPRS